MLIMSHQGDAPSSAEFSPNDNEIPLAWARNADALADWAWSHLVNRRDCYGRYIAVEARRDPDLTAFTDKRELTPAVLRCHFIGASTGDLVGLHSTVRDEPSGEGEVPAFWSRWVTSDLDRHDEQKDPASNLDFALSRYGFLVGLGYRPLLVDSNGAGGYHLWSLFGEPVATEKVYRFGQWLNRDWKKAKLGGAPETFPKQADFPAGRYGNWIRLPGRHHTRDHWTKVWNGERWLAGEEAIAWILATPGDAADLIPAEALVLPKRPRKPSGTSQTRNFKDEAKIAQEALGHIPNTDLHYDDWLRIGMCLTELGNDGFGLWDDWSRQSDKYNEGTCERKWKSFRPGISGGVSLATLFYKAKDHGWIGPKLTGPTIRNAWARWQGKAAGAAGNDGGKDGGGATAGEASAGPAPRPEIEINTERHEVLELTIAALAADPELYFRGFSLVAITAEAREKVALTITTTLEGTAGTPTIVMLSNAVVGCMLTRNASFFSWKKDKHGEWEHTPSHPPDWLVQAVATHQFWPGLKPLLGIAECPFLRRDGSIVEEVGYDVETGIYYRPSMVFPSVPEHPTQADARAAWERLWQPIRQFPFASEADRAVWLAGLLTAMTRLVIGGPAPGVVLNGNKAGTGKGKLIDGIGMIVYGRQIPTSNYPDDPIEAGKVKVAIALSCKPAVHFDNVEEGGTYGNSALDSALTASVVDDRVLGTSKNSGNVPLCVAWFLSGNNISPSKDAYRRWLIANIVTEEEHPEERRDIEIPNLLEHILEHRGEHVRDALTILRAHALAGRPRGDWGPLGSFEAWDEIVRGAVWFATGQDCCATLRAAANDSEDRLAKVALLAGWLELGCAMTAPEAVLKVETEVEAIKKAAREGTTEIEFYPTLRHALTYFGYQGKLMTSRALGKKIAGMKGTVIDGMKFVADGTEHRATRWEVVKVDPKPTNHQKPAETSPGGAQCSSYWLSPSIPPRENLRSNSHIQINGGVGESPEHGQKMTPNRTDNARPDVGEDVPPLEDFGPAPFIDGSMGAVQGNGKAIQYLAGSLTAKPLSITKILEGATYFKIEHAAIYAAAESLEVIKTISDGEEFWDLEQGR